MKGIEVLLIVAGLFWMTGSNAVRADLECTPAKACSTFEKCGLKFVTVNTPFLVRKRKDTYEFLWHDGEDFVEDAYFETEGFKADESTSANGSIFRWANTDLLWTATLMLQKLGGGYLFTMSIQHGTEYVPVGEIIYGHCKGSLE